VRYSASEEKSSLAVYLQKMPRTLDIPHAPVEELAEQLNRLADHVLLTDPTSTDGSNARRLYRLAVRALEVKLAISGDDQIRALLYDAQERIDGCQI
jgi:hypothetical protein